MQFIPNTDKDREDMLKTIGVQNFDQLIESIPTEIRLKKIPALPVSLSELEVTSLLHKIAEQNVNLTEGISFLGAGAYDHWVPSVIDHITSRAEFYTAYTPYQAEVSQGTLQSIFEYQSLICELTGMDVANASMYDGASSTAEAALMSHTATKRDEIIVSLTTHPHYIKVLETYCQGLKLPIQKLNFVNGVTDTTQLSRIISDKTACVIVQQPNFFGCIEPVAELVQLTHKHGALFIVVIDPISLGILNPPGEYNADIVVGEGQPLGNYQSYGGPFLGIFACKDELKRLMPGRVVGKTTDTRGRICYVLTLQTREQHIRREKATSNICSNQALCALRATVYLSILGKHGIREVAELCLQKSHYAYQQIIQLDGVKPQFENSRFFKEFVVHLPVEPNIILNKLTTKKIYAGVDLTPFRIGLDNCILISVTEKRTKQDIDRLVHELRLLLTTG